MTNGAEVVIFWYDYVVFGTMLVLSLSIGLYFGCFGNKYITNIEYLIGNKQMKSLPVAFSTVGSFVSAISVIGIPADVYEYGAAYLLICLTCILSCCITCTVFLPVLYNLEVTTIYQYLNRRFDDKTRKLIALFYLLNGFLYIPLVIHIPVLILSSVGSFDYNFLVLVISGICILYTAVGGFKTVIWTDSAQIIFLATSIITIFVLGENAEGGFRTVWNKAYDGNKLNFFDFNFDPTKRDTFWALVVGYTLYMTCLTACNQTHMQKVMAVPTLRDSVLAQIYYSIGVSLIGVLSVFIGLLIYARYLNCDPIQTDQIETTDQLLLFYVIDITKDVPGFLGLFFAGLFSASLSSQSASLNGTAGVICEDFLKNFIDNMSEKRANIFIKMLVIVLGIFTSSLVFVIARMSNFFFSCVSLLGAVNGPNLAVFTLGVLFPRANSKGAFYGGIIGFLCISSIVIPAKYYQYTGLLKHSPKSLSTDSNCTFLNKSFPLLSTDLFSSNNTPIYGTENTTLGITEFQPFFIFRISHYYYTLIGFVITVISGLLISHFTSSKNDIPVEKALISPIFSKSYKFRRII